MLGDLDSLGAGFQLASHDLGIHAALATCWGTSNPATSAGGLRTVPVMLNAILAAKAGEMGLERERTALSPQITVDAPIIGATRWC